MLVVCLGEVDSRALGARGVGDKGCGPSATDAPAPPSGVCLLLLLPTRPSMAAVGVDALWCGNSTALGGRGSVAM